jgi:hypothetical protein
MIADGPKEVIFEEMVEQVFQSRRNTVVVLAADDGEPVDLAIELGQILQYRGSAAALIFLVQRSSRGKRCSAGSTIATAWRRRRNVASRNRTARMPALASRTEPQRTAMCRGMELSERREVLVSKDGKKPLAA